MSDPFLTILTATATAAVAYVLGMLVGRMSEKRRRRAAPVMEKAADPAWEKRSREAEAEARKRDHQNAVVDAVLRLDPSFAAVLPKQRTVEDIAKLHAAIRREPRLYPMGTMFERLPDLPPDPYERRGKIIVELGALARDRQKIDTAIAQLREARKAAKAAKREARS